MMRFPIVCLLLLISFHCSPGASGDLLTDVERHLAESAESIFLKDLISLLKIPSVSAHRHRRGAIQDAANFLVELVTKYGMHHGQLLTTEKGNPAVYADWTDAPPGAPTVLIYGHYDVVPEDPVDEWTKTKDPFDPVIEGNRIYARGASDDKGHILAPINAIRAFLKVSGALPVNVKVLIEGEEELLSPYLDVILKKHAKLLQADYVYVADGGQVSPTTPGICVGLRGGVALQVDVTVADADMHSGTFGGGVKNPIFAMVQMLSTLVDGDTGKILVDGMYDDVEDISEEDKEEIKKFPTDAKQFLRDNGVNETVGEEGYSFFERTWTRPSLDILSITGGSQGPGVKSIVPRRASAKMAVRLVPFQDKDRILTALRSHLLLAGSKIRGITVSVHFTGVSCSAFKGDKRSAGTRVAGMILEELYGKKGVYFRMGGSIPAMGLFQKMLGKDVTMFAFGHSDENCHAPNEFARLDSFRRSEKAYVRLFMRLGELGVTKEEL